jgi:hypothetical protein
MKPHLRFQKLHRLIEELEIERMALPVLFVPGVLVAGELDVAAICGAQQRWWRAVEAVARAVDREARSVSAERFAYLRRK